jgi:hypothetical protein
LRKLPRKPKVKITEAFSITGGPTEIGWFIEIDGKPVLDWVTRRYDNYFDKKGKDVSYGYWYGKPYQEKL